MSHYSICIVRVGITCILYYMDRRPFDLADWGLEGGSSGPLRTFGRIRDHVNPPHPHHPLLNRFVRFCK